MVELLVSKNADVNAQGGYFGDLQHHQATAKGYKSMTGGSSISAYYIACRRVVEEDIIVRLPISMDYKFIRT